MDQQALSVEQRDDYQEADWQALPESARALTYTVDREFRITSVNDEWNASAAAQGAPHLQDRHILGTNLLDWLAGVSREETRGICNSIFKAEIQQYECRIDCVTPEGPRSYTMSIAPVHDSSGVIIGASFVSHALTDPHNVLDKEAQARQEAEQQAGLAAEQAARLRATVGSMTDGVWMCNQDGALVSVNAAGLAMFGLRRSEVVGKPLSVLASLFDIGRGERRRLGLRQALQGESMHTECEIQFPNSADVLTVDIRATPVRDEQNAVIGAVAVVRDITEAKLLDRLREDFLSIAAHELKTPVTALKGYTQLALKRIHDIPETTSTRRMLETINEQADRVTRLVQRLLDVSCIHSGHLELQFSQFDLQALVVGVAEQAGIANSTHTVEVVAHPPITVTADYLRLEQVVFNLLDNAVKYSPKGGVISIATEATDVEARVTVQDQGMGIPPEKITHIFERWYQAHQASTGDYGGMGLGLFICKEIIEQHAGRIWATPAPGKGTCVSFAIPRAPVLDNGTP